MNVIGWTPENEKRHSNLLQVGSILVVLVPVFVSWALMWHGYESFLRNSTPVGSQDNRFNNGNYMIWPVFWFVTVIATCIITCVVSAMAYDFIYVPTWNKFYVPWGKRQEAATVAVHAAAEAQRNDPLVQEALRELDPPAPSVIPDSRLKRDWHASQARQALGREAEK